MFASQSWPKFSLKKFAKVIVFWQNCFTLFLICRKNVVVDAGFLAGYMDGIQRDWFWPALGGHQGQQGDQDDHNGLVRCVLFELLKQIPFVNIIIMVWRDC